MNIFFRLKCEINESATNFLCVKMEVYQIKNIIIHHSSFFLFCLVPQSQHSLCFVSLVFQDKGFPKSAQYYWHPLYFFRFCRVCSPSGPTQPWRAELWHASRFHPVSSYWWMWNLTGLIIWVPCIVWFGEWCSKPRFLKAVRTTNSHVCSAFPTSNFVSPNVHLWGEHKRHPAFCDSELKPLGVLAVVIRLLPSVLFVHLQLLLAVDQWMVNPFPERMYRFASSGWPTSNLLKRCAAPPALRRPGAQHKNTTMSEKSIHCCFDTL